MYQDNRIIYNQNDDKLALISYRRSQSIMKLRPYDQNGTTLQPHSQTVIELTVQVTKMS